MVQLIRNRLAASTIKLDPRLLLLALAALAAMVAVRTVFYLWRDEGSCRPLYGAGETCPAAEIMQVLDAEGIRYNLHPQSGQVLVRADQLGQARMLLAA